MSFTPVPVVSTMENISLYLPHVLPHITHEIISEVFFQQELGSVKRVDFVSKLNKRGEYYHSAFVHFDYWFDNIISRNFQERLRNPQLVARLMYDDPWFWIVEENKSEKRAPSKPKLRIDLSDLKPTKLDFSPNKKRDSSSVQSEQSGWVDIAYVSCLEKEIHNLREENKKLQEMGSM